MSTFMTTDLHLDNNQLGAATQITTGANINQSSLAEFFTYYIITPTADIDFTMGIIGSPINIGYHCIIKNRGSFSITVRDSSANILTTINSGQEVELKALAAIDSWDISALISVISTNALAANRTIAIAGSQTITNWTSVVSKPDFNVVNGRFTAPYTGTFKINAFITYNIPAVIGINLGPSVDPAFILQRVLPVSTELGRVRLPVFDVAVALILSLRTILTSANLYLSLFADLNAGDVVELQYDADGFLFTLNTTLQISVEY